MNGSGKRFPACQKIEITVLAGLLAAVSFALNEIAAFPPVGLLPAGGRLELSSVIDACLIALRPDNRFRNDIR